MTFQSDASRQGRTFELVVKNNLALAGWRIIRGPFTEPVSMVEIDIEAIDPTDQLWWIECKGSWLSASGRNGADRTDTVKKAIANAALLSLVPGRPPFMLVTSNMPDVGTRGRRWIDLAMEQGWLNRCEVVSMFGSRLPPRS